MALHRWFQANSPKGRSHSKEVDAMPLKRGYRHRSLTIWALGLLLTCAPAAFAGYEPANPTSPTKGVGTNSTRAYEPQNPSSPSRSGGNTTRGNCDSSAGNTLTLLAPLGHIGRTVSTRPTLVWFIPDAKPHPIELSLFEYGSSGKGKRLLTVSLQSAPGLMQWSLPDNQPELSVGKRYLWQVAVLCDRNRPSKDQIAEAVVEVVAPSNGLNAELTTANGSLKRAEAYAKAGFWYDALSATLTDSTAIAFQLTLLDDLIQLESEKDSDVARQQTKQLREVRAEQQKP